MGIILGTKSDKTAHNLQTRIMTRIAKRTPAVLGPIVPEEGQDGTVDCICCIGCQEFLGAMFVLKKCLDSNRRTREQWTKNGQKQQKLRYHKKIQ